MLEFLSNFYLKNEIEEVAHPLPPKCKHFAIHASNAEEQLDEIVEAYKQLHPVVVTYASRVDLKLFLSIFAYKYANIRKRSEFEDVLLINRCVLL